MKMLFLGQYYDSALENLLLKVNKRGLNGAGNTIQSDLLLGFCEILGPANLECETTVPATLYPANCKKLFFSNLRVKYPNGSTKKSLGFINLPFIKELCRFVQFYRKIMKWAKETPGDKVVFTYHLYVPIMRAIFLAQKRLKNELKTCVMVSDLPNKFGMESGRKGIMKWLERFDGEAQLRLVEKFDRFVLMSENMQEVIHIDNKLYCVVEGIVNKQRIMQYQQTNTDDFVIIYYGGILDNQYGIETLLDAFQKIENSTYKLWLCGKGDMVERIISSTKTDKRVVYFGYLSKAEATKKMMQANILINPRPDDNLFTRYSFPSKNLEYLLTGKPVICYKLKGIPNGYDNFFQYVEQPGVDALKQKILEIGEMSEVERGFLGKEGREFVIREKNQRQQAIKIVQLLHREV